MNVGYTITVTQQTKHNIRYTIEDTQVGNMNELTAIKNSEIAYQDITTELYTRFLAYLDASDKTRATYTINLRQMFRYFADNGIRQPSRADIVAYRDYLKDTGHKPTTIQNYITAAKIFFRWTAQEGIYPNIADHIKGAKLNRDHKKDYLTGDQVGQILSGINRDTAQGKRDFAILFLMATCGLRDIEVARANVEDLRTAGGNTVLYVQGKGREEKTEFIRVSPDVERAVRDYLKTRPGTRGADPLFVSTSNNSKGGRLTTRSISGTVKKWMRNAGFDSERLTAHSLRHTAVTLSLLAGDDLQQVQKFARHANITTTMIYNHSLDMASNTCSLSVSNEISRYITA